MAKGTVLVFFATVASCMTAVARAAACTPAQLRGTFGTFSLPGGGGSYAQGTDQVVSWTWPTGSNVTRIQGVVIHGTSDINLSSVSGVPVNFVRTQPDQAGAIFVTLPNPLATGNYVFRVSLLSSGQTCTIDSAPFTVVPGNNINECNLGDSRCASGNTGVQVCQNTPSGRRYGPATTCPGGATCSQTGNTATCSIVNECNLGESRCANNNGGTQVCQNTPAGRRFGPVTNCPAGTSCRQTGSTAICTSGLPTSCSASNAGHYVCNGDGYRICAINSSGGFSFTDTLSCGPGTTCQQSGPGIYCVAKLARRSKNGLVY